MTPLNRFDVFPYGRDVSSPSSLRNPDGLFPENDVPPPDPIAVLIFTASESIGERLEQLKSRFRLRRERRAVHAKSTVACQ